MVPIFSGRHSFLANFASNHGCCVLIQRLVLVYLHTLTFLLGVKFPRRVCQGRKGTLALRQVLTADTLLGASLKQKESLSVR